MYLSAMKLGFTPSDLRTMSFPLLANMFDEWGFMNKRKPEDDGPRMATQADINRMLA